MNGSRVRAATLAAAVGLAILPAVAAAHPLGNFTINHYAGLRISVDRVAVDLVIDEAEIPTFQERQRIDTDADGTVTAGEVEAERAAMCGRIAQDIHLAADGTTVPLRPVAGGLSFPAGAGGLPTMRTVCEFDGSLARPVLAAASLTFTDGTFSERIGWREIVVDGDGVTPQATTAPGAMLRSVSRSGRLTRYPVDQLAQPLDDRSVAFDVQPGGPALAAWTAPDAQPLVGGATPGSLSPSGLAAVPNGVTEELSGLIHAGDLSPALLLGSLLVALGLGAAHALSPGHGKTIMAAYLMGTRGTARQAIGLGLTVTVSHTLGVLALAVITLGAASTLPPERLYPILGLVSGSLVVVIGANLLWQRLRPVLRGGAHDASADHGHEHGHDHGGGHEHGHTHGHGHDHGDGHAHGDAHSASSALSARRLFALGLSGGLVPSASALILLLGSIAAGRVAYGLVLVLAFGVGMAVVLGGVGLVLVQASRLVDRMPRLAASSTASRLWLGTQLVTAAFVVVLGLVLTTQAVGQVV
jgi:nickel/cobalt transporter (NicO) family protein